MIILLVFQLTAAVNDFSGLTGGRWYNIDVGNIIYVYIYITQGNIIGIKMVYAANWTMICHHDATTMQ